MSLFTQLEETEVVLRNKIAKLAWLLKRKRLRYEQGCSRLSILVALQQSVRDSSTNRTRQLAGIVMEQADAYKRLAATEGAIRWIERSITHLRSQLP